VEKVPSTVKLDVKKLCSRCHRIIWLALIHCLIILPFRKNRSVLPIPSLGSQLPNHRTVS
jgi:hypothetical protein